MARNVTKPTAFTLNSSMLVHHNPQSPIAEQYRTIRNNIRYASAPGIVHSLVITSPSGGEGKTTAAMNLAVSMAQKGERVLLVDANIRRPTLHYVMKQDRSPGLTDALAGLNPIAEVIRSTEVDGLSLLTCGSLLHNAAELLDSSAMQQLLQDSRQRYDAVLFDCSAVLESPDAGALASKCDGTVLVLKSGKTNQNAAIEAKLALEFGQARVVGAILNKRSGRE